MVLTEDEAWAAVVEHAHVARIVRWTRAGLSGCPLRVGWIDRPIRSPHRHQIVAGTAAGGQIGKCVGRADRRACGLASLAVQPSG